MRSTAFHFLLVGFLALCAGSLTAQNLYIEDFENETPVNAGDLCEVGNEYSPAFDGNWSLGPACANPGAGTPKLVDITGETWLEYNDSYPADSEVWNSATVDVSSTSNVAVSFDLRSTGSLDAGGGNIDRLEMFAVLDGTQSATPLFSVTGHVNGMNNAGEITVNEDVDVSGASSLALRMVIKLTGADERYQLDDVSMCSDSNGDGVCNECDEPLEIYGDVSDYTVQCADDLPTMPGMVTAERGNLGAVIGAQGINEQEVVYNATPAAGTDNQTDWALKLFNFGDVAGNHVNFVPTAENLQLREYSNGVAILEGQVANEADPSEVFNVHVTYTNLVSGEDWPNGFKTANECMIPLLGDASTDNWNIYVLEPSQSYLSGEGGLSGSLLTLEHAPDVASGDTLPYFGFQVGEGANDRNCALGAGGWLTYSGTINGVAVSGSTGDFNVDLTPTPGGRNGEPCVPNDLCTDIIYTVIDTDCPENGALTVTQTVCVADDTDPTFDNAPANVTLECGPLPAVPTVTASDNCTHGAAPVVTYLGQVTTDSTSQFCYTVVRQWTAVDCSGNGSGHTQTIVIQDTQAPTAPNANDYTAECDGAGNVMEFEAWLTSVEGTSTDNCGGSVSYTNNSQYGTPNWTGFDPVCGGSMSKEVIFYAIDECGNFSEGDTATFLIDDTVAPSAPVCENDTVECDGSGNLSDFEMWLTHVEGTSSDVCSAVSYTNDSGYGTDAWTGFDEICGGKMSKTVTFYALDACDNYSAGCTATFLIDDTTAPSVPVCESDTVECDGTGNLADFEMWLTHVEGTSTDACSDVSYTNDSDYGTSDWTGFDTICGGKMSKTVTFYALDACNNFSAGCTATFLIDDTTAPSVPVCTDETVECDGTGNLADFEMWLSHVEGTSTDACSDVSYTNDSDYGTSDWTGFDTICGGKMSKTVTFYALDACNNFSAGCTATFLIDDTTAPSVPVCTDETVECDGTGNLADFEMWLSHVEGTSTDACSDVSYTNDSDYGTSDWTGFDTICGGKMSKTVTFYALDACNNFSAGCTATFLIDDTTAPEWDSYVPYQYGACDSIPDPTDPTDFPITATDDCSGVTYEVMAYQMSGGCPGTWMRSWVAIDACGNRSDTIDQYIQLYDDQAPVLTLTCSDYTVNFDANCMAATDTAAAGVPTTTMTDNCDAAPHDTLYYSDGAPMALCGSSYTFDRTWTYRATDLCDQTDSVMCVQTITVNDVTAPSVPVCMDETVECDGMGNMADFAEWLTHVGGTSTDNCAGLVSYTNDSDYGTSDWTGFDTICGGKMSKTVTFYALDACNNFSAGCTATFLIDDTTPPTISGLPVDSIACDEWMCDAEYLEEAGYFTVDEACGDYTLSISCTEFSGNCVTPVAAYQVTITAVDECNNPSAPFIQIINLYDDEKPTLDLTCPAAYNTTLDAMCMAVTDTATAGTPTYQVDDNCDENVEVVITYEDAPISLTCMGDDDMLNGSYSFVRTFTATATDHCMNSETATCTQTITVTDNTAPSITCPADVTVECDGSGNADDLAAFLAGATATDNCDSDVSITHDYMDGDLSDDCGATGTVMVTFTATDDCNNSTSCSATFTIVDTTAPTIGTMADNQTVECDGAGNMADLDAWLAGNGGAMASDDCSSVTWYNNYDCAIDAGDFLTYNQGSLGNANSVAGSDYLDANFASVFPTGVSVGCADGYELLFTSAAAVDTYLPCTGGAQDLVLTSGGIDPNAAAPDPSCWNNAFVSHLLTAKINAAFDAADPAYSASDFPVTGLIRTSGALAGYSLGEIIAMGDAVIGGCSTEFTPNQLRGALRDFNQNFDNGVNLGRFQLPGCDNSVSLSDDCGTTGAVTVTFTAVDECGNSSSTSAMFTIEDTTGPTAPVAVSDTVECDGMGNLGEFEMWLDHVNGTSSDVCGDVVAYTNNSGYGTDGFIGFTTTCGGASTITVTFSAIDDCGNYSAGSTATFTIQDTTAPSAPMCEDETVECDGMGNLTEFAAWLTHVEGTSTDDCSAISYTNDSDYGTDAWTGFDTICGGSASKVVTFYALDACGNQSMGCTATFLIEDTTAPEMTAISCPADATVYQDANCSTDASPMVTGMATATASDVCGGDIEYTITYADGAATYSCDESAVCMEELYSEDFENETPANAANLCHDATPYIPADGNWGLGPACMILTNGIPQLIDDGGDTHLLFNNEYGAGDEVFNSAAIDISGMSTVRIAFDARSQGDVEASGPYLDQFEMFIVVDGVKTSIFQADGHVDGTSGGGNNAVRFASYEDNVAVSGSSMYLSLEVKISGSGAQEQYGIDNLSICSVDDQAEGHYSFVRTWSAYATDACDNDGPTVTCEQTITVLDTIAPMITCPADITVECDGMGNADDLAAFLAGASATDNCDSDVTITHDFTTLSDLCGATGAATVTFTATDDCGNESTCSATFTIEDTTAPSAPVATSTTVECDGMGNLTEFAAWLDHVNGTSSDVCGDVVAYTNNSGYGTDGFIGFTPTCGGASTITVTFSAIDDCGNYSAGSTATFTIQDTTAPSAPMCEDETVECDGMGNLTEFAAWLTHVEGTSTDDCSSISYTNDSDYGTDAWTGFDTICGGSASKVVTFYALDACGNQSMGCTATFLIEDTTPPTITASNEVSVACDEYSDAVAYEYSADDVCSGVTTTFTDVQQSAGCAGSYLRTYTATDGCGKSSTFEQVILLTDDEAPPFDISCPGDVTLYTDAMCSVDVSEATLGSATYSNVMDNCDNMVEMEVTSNDVVTPGCTGSYTIARTFTITGTDHCMNETVKSCTQTITVLDNTAPTIQAEAMDMTVECDGSGNGTALEGWLNSQAGAVATDACSAVTWSHDYMDGDLSDECGATGSVTVIFTATDACDNASTTSATFTIVDETDPALSVTWPADANLTQNATCDIATGTDALGMATATATDACSNDDVAIVISSEDGATTYTCTGDDDVLEGSYTFERVWTVTATDLCDNATTQVHTQTIVVTDNTAPQFTETCDIMNDPNGENPIPVCCEDLSGTVTIPAACAVEATDNCDSEVAITYTETYVGEFAPTDMVESYCASTTPEAYADGETCNYQDPHSFVLFGLGGETVHFTSVGAGTVSQNVDGTWSLEQELTNADNDGGLTIAVTYGEAYSWTEWQNQSFPTGYKRDCGVLDDDHENWDYRIMQSGSAEGTGIYDGLSLTLSHAPANHYYALQIGLGANNQNNNYGYSGWIMATGTANTGTDGEEAVFFSGDLFGDLDCCLPWSIDRDYVAVDDCENESTFSYSISVNGEDCMDDDEVQVSGSQDGDHTPVVIGGAGDVMTGKTPIRVTNLQPNPTNDLSLLGFTVTQNMRLRVDMYTMDGLLVTELFDGVASPNVNHTLDIDADDLESGMYQIRLSSAQYLVVKKLLVTE